MAALKFLIIEDSPTMRQLIRFSIKRIPHAEIIEANDGLDGLKKLSSNQIDMILTDINMPIMDGLKLVSMVRGNDNYKDIPIVIITTEGAGEDRDRAMALGANAYVTKPIQSTSLLSTVKKLLDI
ncbi:MAG: response regulator [Deltaproteobacteria bacterium]|nr:response regulator [Deltaproteobacteria bacterium]